MTFETMNDCIVIWYLETVCYFTRWCCNESCIGTLTLSLALNPRWCCSCIWHLYCSWWLGADAGHSCCVFAADKGMLLLHFGRLKAVTWHTCNLLTLSLVVFSLVELQQSILNFQHIPTCQWIKCHCNWIKHAQSWGMLVNSLINL